MKKYATDRTRAWREQKLNESFVQTLDRIEEHGCEIWSIQSDFVAPSFSYTVGVHDTSSNPEIITVGLAMSVAHHALNEAARRMRSGVDLTVGRHRDLVGEVEVEFKVVSSAWLHQIMLRTNWFYGGEDVPVLQMIYPDLENRFSNDPNFDEEFAQPDLSLPVPIVESVATDLWKAYDSNSSLSRWKFPTSPHTNAYLSESVNAGTEAITYVSHDYDGAWQFLGPTMSDSGGPVLVCLHHPVDSDRTTEELADLPKGWYATRLSKAESWIRHELPPDEIESALIN